MKHIDIYIFLNATKLCNINCKHCFLTLDNRKHNNQIIDIDKFIVFLKNPFFEKKNIEIVWEGGEISTIDYDLLEEMIGKLDKNFNNIRQTCVTNMFNMDDRFIELIKKCFNSSIETTFAFGDKETWDDNGQKYLDKFKENVIKTHLAGISCPINLELNSKTINMGTKDFIDYFIEITDKTQQDIFIDLDYSINFNQYLNELGSNPYGYPNLLLQDSYSDISKYLKKLYLHIESTNSERNQTIHIGLFNEIENNEINNSFNVLMEDRFFTINPDGNVTTNPLFSDLKNTYIGNIYKNTSDQILNHEGRHKRKEHELKRQEHCKECDEFEFCQSSSSHVPVFVEGDIECCGYLGLRKFIKRNQNND